MPRLLGPILFLALALPQTGNAATIRIPRTGQNACYSELGAVIPCANTGQDGEKQMGVPWPSPRFIDNENGTLTDNLTGLIWLKDANCTETVGGITRAGGLLDWSSAIIWSKNLASGHCGLSDHSVAGDWRLPNINELRSLVDYSGYDRDLPSAQPFSNVQSEWYWSSTSNPVFTAAVYSVSLDRGSMNVTPKGGSPPPLNGSRVVPKVGNRLGVWPVRNER